MLLLGMLMVVVLSAARLLMGSIGREYKKQEKTSKEGVAEGGGGVGCIKFIKRQVLKMRASLQRESRVSTKTRTSRPWANADFKTRV